MKLNDVLLEDDSMTVKATTAFKAWKKECTEYEPKCTFAYDRKQKMVMCNGRTMKNGRPEFIGSFDVIKDKGIRYE